MRKRAWEKKKRQEKQGSSPSSLVPKNKANACC
jgi:hypothetical protein